MKKILLTFINIYQFFVSPTLKQLLGTKSFCRYSPTCSEYAKVQIEKEGAIKGLGLAFKRLLSCQPFNKKALRDSGQAPIESGSRQVGARMTF